MSIVIKIPSLPRGASEARINYWYKNLYEVVARGEVLAELSVFGEIIPIQAPQAGILERIFFRVGEHAPVGAVLAYLRSGLPDLVWDEEQETLIWNVYNAGRDESKRYDLQQLLRAQEGKIGKGFGNTLALPQSAEENRSEAGQGYGQGYQKQYLNHPAFQDTQQMSGDFKNPRVMLPSSEAAQREPHMAPAYSPTPNLSNAPTLKR